MQDLISVIIPTYNGEKYIQECIKSIQNQNMNVEIIVIDDISTDNTVEIAQNMGIRVIVNDVHKGQVAGKNTGIREAKGKYWFTIDQDDKLVNGALKTLYEEMEKSPDNMIIMAQLRDFPQTPDQQKFCKLKPFYGILTGSTLFKKEVFDKIGFFREDLITGDVIDLTNRLSKAGIEIKKVDFVTCDRRIHDQNYGRTNQADEYKDYAKLLRERLSLR
jgi:glycosyltransferase involved in cell wall biosynthesis